MVKSTERLTVDELSRINQRCPRTMGRDRQVLGQVAVAFRETMQKAVDEERYFFNNPDKIIRKSPVYVRGMTKEDFHRAGGLVRQMVVEEVYPDRVLIRMSPQEKANRNKQFRRQAEKERDSFLQEMRAKILRGAVGRQMPAETIANMVTQGIELNAGFEIPKQKGEKTRFLSKNATFGSYHEPYIPSHCQR
jgi:hypothetical protein